MRMKVKAGGGNACQMGAAEYERPWNTDSGGTECMVHARSHGHRTRESHKSMHSSVALLGTSGKQAVAGPVNLCGRFQILSDDSLSLVGEG